MTFGVRAMNAGSASNVVSMLFFPGPNRPNVLNTFRSARWIFWSKLTPLSRYGHFILDDVDPLCTHFSWVSVFWFIWARPNRYIPMAGKSRPMSQIKQLIRLHRENHPIKTIARHLSISKNTVKSYLKKVTDLNLSLERMLELEGPVLELMLRSGNPAYRDERFEYLKERLPYFEKELSRIGVNRRLLWEEYLVAHPQGYSYAQFCFHLKQLLVSRRDGSMILDHEPGDKLFIDFSGKKLGYIDHETGEIILCEIFVACLPYSNYCFAMAVPSQRSPDFLYALDCCLQFLGGVPRAIVPDNLKSAVIRTDRYEPEINRSMEELANHYDTVVVPARPQVFARLRNRQFFDLPSLSLAIGECIERLNQTRMQDRNYCRQERFLSNELSSLRQIQRLRFTEAIYEQISEPRNFLLLRICYGFDF